MRRLIISFQKFGIGLLLNFAVAKSSLKNNVMSSISKCTSFTRSVLFMFTLLCLSIFIGLLFRLFGKRPYDRISLSMVNQGMLMLKVLGLQKEVQNTLLSMSPRWLSRVYLKFVVGQSLAELQSSKSESRRIFGSCYEETRKIID